MYVVFYTGRGANKSSIHNVDTFLNIAKKHSFFERGLTKHLSLLRTIAGSGAVLYKLRMRKNGNGILLNRIR